MFEFLIFNWGFALRNLFKRREKIIDRFSILVWFIPFLILDFVFIMLSSLFVVLCMFLEVVYIIVLSIFSFIIWVFYADIFEYIDNRLGRHSNDVWIIILSFGIFSIIFGFSFIMAFIVT